MKGRHFLVIIFLSLLSTSVFAIQKRTFCVWDPVGRNGPVMTFYSDLIPKAQAWGLGIRFIAYTDEHVAVREFKAGKCEAAVLTSILSRQFVKFAGTMDAVGAITSEEGLELALATLARARAGKLMIEGDYEVVTTFPVGSMYAFVRDRSTNTIDEFAGKKLSILNGDPQMRKFADLAGATQVEVTLKNFDDKFNSGEVDIVIMPALAYNTFELYRGLGTEGGIIDYRLYYGMLQTIAKHDQFPEDFGHKMRNYMLTRLKAMNKMVADAEEEIPEKYWIETNQFVKDDIDHFSKRVRIALKDDLVNNSTALKLFWKIRCRLDPSRGECKVSPDKKDKQSKQLAAKKLEQEKLAREKSIQEKLAQEKLALEKLAQEKLDREKLALEKQAHEKLAREQTKLAQQKLALEHAQEQEKRALEQERKAIEQAKLALEQQRQALAQKKQEQQEQLEQQEQEQGHWWDFLFFWI